VIRAEWSIRVERPVEEVFDLISDLDREAEWNPDASNAVRTSVGELGLGAVWEQDFRPAGHVVSTIDGWERPRRVSFHSVGPQAEAHVRYEFLPVGSSETEIRCRIAVSLRGVARLLEPLRGGAYKRRLERQRGAQLKRALER